jgi:hypothetical protein
MCTIVQRKNTKAAHNGAAKLLQRVLKLSLIGQSSCENTNRTQIKSTHSLQRLELERNFISCNTQVDKPAEKTATLEFKPVRRLIAPVFLTRFQLKTAIIPYCQSEFDINSHI